MNDPTYTITVYGSGNVPHVCLAEATAKVARLCLESSTGDKRPQIVVTVSDVQPREEDHCTPWQIETLRRIRDLGFCRRHEWTGKHKRLMDELCNIGRDGTRRSVVAVAADGTLMLTPHGAAIARASIW